MEVVNLCWNEFFSKANNKNVIKIRGWVKICWNDFQSKTNDKNVINGGGRVKYVGMIFLVNLTKN